ncbi:MAG: phosphoribosyltransferase family protein [Patescibacteria group bacterium]
MIKQFFVQALMPEFCVSCHEEGSLFCAACQMKWEPEPIVDAAAFSCGSYKDKVLQSLLQFWKYQYVENARAALLDIVGQALQDYHWVFPDVEAVTYVPLHWRKANERGFDQARMIAERVAEELQVPCLTLLNRDRYTTPQARVERSERTADKFMGVFGQAPSLPAEPLPSLLLVDDVMTTGTTLGAARDILKAAGAPQVTIFTIARG